MDGRPLGSTGLTVGLIGLGLFKLGRNENSKHPTPYELPGEAEAIDLLRTAAELGVNLLDTAPSYGLSERRLGRLMHRLDWLGGRDRWVVCTKVGEEFEGGRSVYNFAPEQVRRSVRRSLEAIGVSWLDLVLIHSNGEDRRILEELGTLEALQDLKREGVVRAAGLSVKAAEGGVEAIRRGADVLMVSLNPLDPDGLPLVHQAAREGVGVLIKKPLVSGHLVPGDDPVRQCLGWILQAGGEGISSIVVGTAHAGHLRQDVETAGDCLRQLPPRP